MMDLKHILTDLASSGAVLGHEMIADAVQNIKYGIECLDPEVTGTSFGDLEDVISGSGNSFSLDGIHNAKSSITNIGLFAGTGAGKTSVTLLPTLLRMDGPSIVVFDPSNTVKVTFPHFARNGYEIHVINYSDILHSASVNLFNAQKSDDDCARFSAHLAHAAHEGSKGDMFFIQSAASTATFLMKLLLRSDAKYRNMANLLHLANNLTVKGGLNKLAVRLCDDGMWSEFKSLVGNQSEKTIGSIMLSVKLMLQYWASDSMARVSAINTIDLDSLRARKQLICICTNTYDSFYYKTLNSVTIETILKSLMREVKPDSRPVYCLIDEAATCDLPSLSSIVSNTRKYKIYNLLCYQNINQLINAYGRDAGNNILANVSKLFYGHTDYGTAKDLSDLFGTVTNTDKRGREQTKPLMPAHKIAHMSKDQGLFVHKNVPYKLSLVPWFKQPRLQYETRGEPFIYSNPHIPGKVELIPLS